MQPFKSRKPSIARAVSLVGIILPALVEGVLTRGSSSFVAPLRSRGSHNEPIASFVTQLQERSDDAGLGNATASDQLGVTKGENNGVVEGIGGKGGLVYDVNRLKRNLLQETMTAYKEELWDLLVGGDDEKIVEKLQALVQASPVRTTTDSNLLDNQEEWILAYRSQFPTTVSSLVLYENDGTSSLVSSYNPRYAFLWDEATTPQEGSGSKSKNFFQRNVVSNKFKEFSQTKQRSFRLADLEDDEDAHVLDTTLILGGLITKTKRYSLDGLTRSSLTLKKVFSLWSLLGRASSKRLDKTLAYRQKKQQASSNGQQQSSLSVQIVYLDNDLCILTEEDGPDSPFIVYTRNTEYVNAYTSTKRKLKALAEGSFCLLLLPVRAVRNRRKNRLAYSATNVRRRRKKGTAAQDELILKEIIQSEPKPNSNATAVNLRVLRLGDVNEEEEDESWESESDPFVHLSADERQQILKGMSVEEVEQAASTYRNNRARFRWFKNLFSRRRKTSFKKPPENWKRPKKRG